MEGKHVGVPANGRHHRFPVDEQTKGGPVWKTINDVWLDLKK